MLLGHIIEYDSDSENEEIEKKSRDKRAKEEEAISSKAEHPADLDEEVLQFARLHKFAGAN